MAKTATALVKNIKVIEPETVDGLNPRYDEDGKVITRETILPATAEREYRRNTARYPKQLQPKFEPVTEAAQQKTAAEIEAEAAAARAEADAKAKAEAEAKAKAEAEAAALAAKGSDPNANAGAANQKPAKN